MAHAYAPIALFAFNRPDHLRQTLAALAANELAAESDLTIFCDGPRSEQEKTQTDKVRAIAKAAGGFASIRVVERERNLGCAQSVITGVSEIFEKHERIIVIEDDIVTSPFTLRFLNNCLEQYETAHTIFNIAAWSPPKKTFSIPGDYTYDVYCIPRFNCWGWASWRDRWKKVDWALCDYELFSKAPRLQKAFNAGGADLSPMLDLQVKGKIDSWAVRMDYARFKHGCVGLNPVFSYSTNIGMDAGTHTTDGTARFDNDISLALAEPRTPEHIFVDQDIARAYRKVYSPPFLLIRTINKAWKILFGKRLFDV